MRHAVGGLVLALTLAGAAVASRPGARAAPAGSAGTAGSAAAPGGTPTKSGAVVFTEVTAEAGLDFTHVHGGTGRKYYIETVSPGVCWLDYDNDGFIDAYLVQSGPLPGTPRTPASPVSRLYRNNGNGAFTDVTGKAGVANAAGYGSGCTAGDYDNDGDEDLYVTNFGPSVLYRNNGDGTFSEVAAAAGVQNGLYAAGAAWADYDNDGRLDLFVATYVDFTINDEKFCGNVMQNRRSYCHPDAYGGLPDLLYHNEGQGRFKEVAKVSGVWDPNGKGLGVVWFDLDADGDVDLYVANDATPNTLYRNDGNGRFTDITLLSGACCSEDGRPESGMGVSAGDADGDGFEDIIVTNLSNEVNQLYHNLGGKGLFSIDSYPSGLAAPSLLTTSWGTHFFDYDNDGDLDLMMTNGHPMDDIHVTTDILNYDQKPFLFENQGKAIFKEVGAQHGAYFSARDVGRGLATGDFDNDGDRDVLLGPNGRKAHLLRNDGGNRAGHWITLRLVGVQANRDAIGARVTITAGGRKQVAEVRSGSSYMSQHDMRLHFGLGAAGRVDRIEVRWPVKARKIETVGPLPADQFVTIKEGSGVVSTSPPGAAHR